MGIIPRGQGCVTLGNLHNASRVVVGDQYM